MARGAAKQRPARPKPDARRGRSGGGARVSSGGYEQQLFFNRLRRQAKWVFVLLAVAFAGTFVFLGVGSGSTGIGDLLNGNLGGLFGGGSSGPSISKAQSRVKKDPSSAAAALALATAYTSHNRDNDAISALERFRGLHPHNGTVLDQLATLYSRRAQTLSAQASAVQQETQGDLAGSTFLPSPTSKIGQALSSNPVVNAGSTQANQRLNDAFGQLNSALANVEGVYKELAKLRPSDTQLQLQLASAAINTRDITTAVAAYKRFLKLAPDDPNAPAVKRQLKALQATLPKGSSG